ncbi:MAG: glutamate--tRNA ligase [Saprospiraceae bacterium]
MTAPRLRFAPSPTGALHIGGVRTALYNYLLAKQLGGTFILRIEDTDQTRYVAGAEDYITESLAWCGLTPAEGPGEYGGNYGPYRQSERREIYQRHTQELLDSGRAYYAFDSNEELNAHREAAETAGGTFRYDAGTRGGLRNSLSLPAAEVEKLLQNNTPYTVRLLVEAGHTVHIHDVVRGEVIVATDELDDKVLMKADGLPTYHLANIVDDHLMEITHVIRGEEWLPSTAHHVLLYQAFGWEDTMPKFAHLPLILKPTGKGKLSKRDGAKLGIPVFPISWEGDTEEDSFEGFREAGFLPEAVINFLALLGWNPGTERELFSLEELTAAFSLDRVGKSGARFDFDKAKWFNQQYLKIAPVEELLPALRADVAAHGHTNFSDDYLNTVIELFRERVITANEFYGSAAFLFDGVKEYDDKMLRKKWSPERVPFFEELRTRLKAVDDYSAGQIKAVTTGLMEEQGLGFGAVLPLLRIAIAGTASGPDAFAMLELLGKEEVDKRLATFLTATAA